MALTTPRPHDPQAVAYTPDGKAVPGTAAAFRVFQRSDGSLCRESDPDAAFLRYPVGALVVVQDEPEYRKLAGETTKRASRPANKMMGKQADKGA